MDKYTWTPLDVLTALSSAYWGKQYYFEQENGQIYSRDSGKYMALDDAITEFANKLRNDGEQICGVHAAIYDTEEIHENCTVQIWANSVTGDVSVGWWSNE